MASNLFPRPVVPDSDKGKGPSNPAGKGPAPLRGLAAQIKAHWKKYRPKLARALEEKGQLNEAVQAAADQTSEALAEAVASGQDWHQAWEALKEQWAFLPSEEDVPELGSRPPDEPPAPDAALRTTSASPRPTRSGPGRRGSAPAAT